MIKRFFSLLLITVILMSCASSYKPIYPQKLNFANQSTGSDINYAYRFNILSETGNKKYVNKENKHGVKLIAIEIENKTDKEIILRDQAKFYLGERVIFPMEPTQIQKQIKQPAGLYMLWSLLWVFVSKCENNDCTTIPLPVGLVIGIGNTSMASNANKKLMMELMANNILDKRIAPGEKAVGLIGVTTDQVQPLRIELSK